MTHRLGLFAIAWLIVPLTPAPFGGWAVITVEDLPEYLEAGRPTTVEFTIRQHGRTPMDDRSPSVTLKRPGAGWLAQGRRFPAGHVDGPGRYAAIITAADTGTVEITIDSDWRSSRVTLLPLPVVSDARRVAALPDRDRGRALFVAKGCVTCHVKADDPGLGEQKTLAVGPALTGRGFPLEWLGRKLADPAVFRVGTGQAIVMPNLSLSPPEIAALASYVNSAAGTRAATVGR